MGSFQDMRYQPFALTVTALLSTLIYTACAAAYNQRYSDVVEDATAFSTYSRDVAVEGTTNKELTGDDRLLVVIHLRKISPRSPQRTRN